MGKLAAGAADPCALPGPSAGDRTGDAGWVLEKLQGCRESTRTREEKPLPPEHLLLTELSTMNT